MACVGAKRPTRPSSSPLLLRLFIPLSLGPPPYYCVPFICQPRAAGEFMKVRPALAVSATVPVIPSPHCC